MKRLFIFLSALFALFLLQVAPAQAISLGSKTASAKGPDTLLIIQLDPNYVGKPGEIEKRIFDSFADEVKKAGHTVVPFAQAQKDLRIYLREEADTDTQREQDLGVVLKSKDFKALAAKENVQYVLLVSTRTTSAEVKENFFTGQRKNLTVLTNIVLYDAKAGDYLADQSYTEIGKTSGSYDRAYSRATNKLLDEVNVADFYKGNVY